MVYRTTAELKSMARGRMLGNYGVAVSAFLLLEGIYLIVSQIITYVVDVNSAMGMIMYGAISIIINLIGVVFMVGETAIYLKLACGSKASALDVFSGFQTHPDKAIWVELSVLARMLATLVPAMIAGGLYFITGQKSDILLVVVALALIAGAVGCIYIRIATSQCYYILLDFPEYSAKEVLALSHKLMQGHMWHYVGIVVSFIPIMLLGMLSLFIGMLFIYPYYRMTMTEFYLDIVRQPQQELSTFSVEV